MLDGLATLAHLQHLNPAVRYFFMTGTLDSAVLEEVRGVGQPTVFPKPFAFRELTAALRACVRAVKPPVMSAPAAPLALPRPAVL